MAEPTVNRDRDVSHIPDDVLLERAVRGAYGDEQIERAALMMTGRLGKGERMSTYIRSLQSKPESKP